MVFTGIGLAAIGVLIDLIVGQLLIKNDNVKRKKYSKIYGTFLIASVIICLVSAYNRSMNTDYMKMAKEDHFLYQFKEIVQQEENPTLLNVNMLDAGLYTVAEVVPSVKYFQTNGIPLKEMFDEQERYIKEGITQFVIWRFDYPEYILDKYELVAESSFMTNGKNESMYYLFKRKD